MRLGIIVGTTRPGRIGGQVGAWARSVAEAAGVEVDLMDLAAIALPFLNEEEEPLTGTYALPHTRAWAARVASVDALLLVTAEYNSSFPAPLKNALDALGPEWRDKPVGSIGYGGTSAGTRAVQALLPVLAALGMVPLGAVYLPHRARVRGGTLLPTPEDDRALVRLIAKLAGFTARVAPPAA